MTTGATTFDIPGLAPTSRGTAAIRGPVLTFTGDPFRDGIEQTVTYERDAIVVMAEGKVTDFGPADQLMNRLPPWTPVTNYGQDTLITAGFIDCHVHFPQTPMIGSYGAQLRDWLNKYTFPTEQKFADKELAPTSPRCSCASA